MKKEEIKKAVSAGYAKIVRGEGSCCSTNDSSCKPDDISKNIGYTDNDLQSVPKGANLGLGCGNPVAIASLKEGEVVVDLGSGAGFDCFLAANKVGRTGRVIGIDMTPEMIERARANASKGGYENVEFRLGEIENLPVADNGADIIISNCVINLSPDKKSVFKEAYRVIKPGGRIMVSDMVLLRDLPEFIKKSVEAYIGCISGAMIKGDYLEIVRDAGFQDVKIVDEAHFPVELMENDPTVKSLIEKYNIKSEDVKDLTESVVSIKLNAVKPL